MDFQRNIVWIVLGAVLLVGVALYFALTPGGSELSELASTIENESLALKKYSGDASKADAVKTAAHVKAAKEYNTKIKAQIDELKTAWSAKQIKVKQDNVPQDDAKFNLWLDDVRVALKKQLDDAKVALPKDFDEITFKDPTDSRASDTKRQRSVRLRYVTVLEEVVAALTKKSGKMETVSFQPDQTFEGKIELVDVGATAWNNITFYDPVQTAARNAEVSKEVLIGNAGRAPAGAPPKGVVPPVELPVNVASCDLTFTAPAQVVPAILKTLESSERYHAVIGRFDTLRAAAQPFPDPKPGDNTPVPPAGPGGPGNSHYQEGAIRVLVTLYFYEYEKSKEEAFAKSIEGGAKAQPAAKK